MCVCAPVRVIQCRYELGEKEGQSSMREKWRFVERDWLEYLVFERDYKGHKNTVPAQTNITNYLQSSVPF